MSKKIFLLDENQKVTEQPRQKISKNVAMLMLRRLQVERITANLYRRLPGRIAAVKAADVMRQIAPPKIYIPAEMPRPEVSGVIFEEPESAKATKSIRRFRVVAADSFVRAAGVGQ